MWSRRKEKEVEEDDNGNDNKVNRRVSEMTENVAYVTSTPSSSYLHGSHGPKRIIILGGGFAGVEVLKRLQKKFKNNERIEITLISRDNFILFTPMLPEVASGMIETS